MPFLFNAKLNSYYYGKFWIILNSYAGGILSGENGTSGPGATGAINNVISQQGIKSLVHDVQIKRQREIRDMMKKKREKAVLVDRISRWLFPTSFILLNIVYWALFGDHELWWIICVIVKIEDDKQTLYSTCKTECYNFETCDMHIAYELKLDKSSCFWISIPQHG